MGKVISHRPPKGRCESAVISHRPCRDGVFSLLFHTVPLKFIWLGGVKRLLFHTVPSRGGVLSLLFHTIPAVTVCYRCYFTPSP